MTISTKKLKLLVLSHSSQTAGAEKSMLDLFDTWVQQGKVAPEFIIRMPLEGLAKELHKRGWKYYPLYYTNWSQRTPSTKPEDVARNALLNAKATLAVEAIIQKTKPDMVATNTLVAPWAAFAAHFKKLPHIWFIREYGDLDHEHVFEQGRQMTFEDIGTLSDLVVANSNTLAEHMRQYIDRRKLRVLYNPFDLAVIADKARVKIANPFKSKESLKLIIIGRIAPSKGQDEAAEAVGMLNKSGLDVELCVVGEPAAKEHADSLTRIISKYGIAGKVHLVGQQKNPLAFLAFADVGVMASRREAFGRTTFEYMAAGKPVVGADSGATPEMVEPGKNGFLYRQGNAASLASELKRYAVDRGLLLKHGKAGKEKAEAMMHGPHNADTLFKEIHNIIATKPVPFRQPVHFMHRWLQQLVTVQEDYSSKMNHLVSQLEEQRAHNARAEERNARLEQEVAAFRGQLQNLKASTSWRVTSPLRYVSRILRSGIQGK